LNLKLISTGLLITLFSFSLSAQIQPQSIKELETDYQNFFLDSRESTYLHLYKSKLLPGEDLWFAAYIYDLNEQMPAVKSTNLNIQLFDDTGNEITTKTYYSLKGKSHGSISIDSLKLNPGNYYIKASTAYIRSKDETLSHTRPFQVLGEVSKNLQQEDGTAYDLQLFPEGGHLLAGVRNTVGVKISNSTGNELGELPGYVMNKKDTITRFKTNRFGMASFPILVRPNEDYLVSITTKNGLHQQTILSKPEDEGIALTVKDFSDEILISLKTNAQTASTINKKEFYAAIHQEGKLKDFSFQFPDGSSEANIKFPKDSLFTGVNTITIFDDVFQPILERLIYKNFQEEATIKFSGIKNLGDSLKIRLSNMSGKNEISYLSVSTLPAGTKAYDSNQNIATSFLLAPYVKGEIQNPTYYFSDLESPRRRMYDLDLLLITQGWSKYSWEEIFIKKPSEKIIRDQGFKIQGQVFKRNLKKENDMFLRNEVSGEFGIINIEDDNTFEIPNLYVEDGTEFSVGMLNDRNSKLSKPSVRLKVFPDVYHSALSGLELKEFATSTNKTIAEIPGIPEGFVNSGQILDTINIQGTKKIESEKAHGNRLSAMAEYIVIDEADIRSNFYITDLIAKNGFNVRRTPANVEIRSKVPFSFSALPPEPNITLNGARLIGDLSILYTITTDQVESIYINSSASAGRGLNSGGGSIDINLKKGSRRGNNTETIHSIIANNGFEPQKQYYNPKYNSYTANTFIEYGIINWEPAVQLGKGFTDIKILNTLQKKINLYIEGFTNEGTLISKIIEIDTN